MAAENDVRQARRWYLEQASGDVAADFRREVRATHLRIGGNPRLYPEIYRGLRRALVHRFPYAIFYRVRAEDVLVVAIVHQARDPRILKDRG